jgi:gluconate 2-dehydrogenase gamma chain
MATTRREALYQIALSVTAGAASPGLAAAQHNHKPPAPSASADSRKVFNEHEFKTLQSLSNWIIPPDERSKGGIEAGTAEFIEVIAAADPKLQTAFTGGLAWLDHQMESRHGKRFLECSREQQKEMLDQIAYREKAPPDLKPGAAFFAMMRAWTVDAFYSSKIGIEDLGYVGNTAVAEFNGCPEEVVKKLLEKSPV